MSNPNLLTIRRAAEAIGVQYRQLLKATNEGVVPFYQIGKSYRLVDTDEVCTIMKNSSVINFYNSVFIKSIVEVVPIINVELSKLKYKEYQSVINLIGKQGHDFKHLVPLHIVQKDYELGLETFYHFIARHQFPIVVTEDGKYYLTDNSVDEFSKILGFGRYYYG